MNTFCKSLCIALTVCAGLTLHATAKYERFDADPSQQEKPATIRVLLEKNVNQALVEVRGRHMVYTPSTGRQLTSGTSGKREFIRHEESGLKWGNLFTNVYDMRIIPGDTQTSILVNGNQYRGCIEIYDVDGKLTIINETDVESFLKSTLNTKFAEEFDDEVMEAVAIVERTNIYYWIDKNRHNKWHIDAQQSNYQGYGATLQNLLVDKAVDNSRHVILTQKKFPFATSWTKNSAGKTADFTTLFRKNVTGCKGLETPYAALDRQKAAWAFSMKKSELATILGLKELAGLDLFVDKTSSKVYGVRVRDQNTSKNIDFITLQRKLGEKKLHSSDFIVNVKGSSIFFQGYGEGHGVGLCLYSASRMAEKGEKAPKILSVFFPNAQLEHAKTWIK
ncbi:MAG: SpoIID/LytB domain-containing protein [Chlamydiales bacterium]